MSIEARVTREIEEVHKFFEDWFNAEIDQTEAEFDRFASVLAEGFVLIGLDGEITPRESLLEAIWDHWRHPADEGRTIAIDTHEVELLRREGELLLATYVEHQETDVDSNRRRSSVLFRRDDDPSNGLAWLYVQETPLPAE